MARSEQKLFKDPTVTEVMVGNQWWPVKPGSWRVDLRGPFLHAAWISDQGTHFSAFISKVQMVRHDRYSRRVRLHQRKK